MPTSSRRPAHCTRWMYGRHMLGVPFWMYRRIFVCGRGQSINHCSGPTAVQEEFGALTPKQMAGKMAILQQAVRMCMQYLSNLV
jgi:hypothetical protein